MICSLEDVILKHEIEPRGDSRSLCGEIEPEFTVTVVPKL